MERQYKKMFLGLVLASLAIGICVRIISPVYLLYQFYNDDYTDRFYPVRSVPYEYRKSFIKFYVQTKVKDAEILFLGDSVMYGYASGSQYIASTLLKEYSGYKVANFTIEDGRVRDMLYITKLLIEADKKFKYSFYNTSFSHVNSPELSHIIRKDTVEKLSPWQLGVFLEYEGFRAMYNKVRKDGKPPSELSLKSVNRNYYGFTEENFVNYFSKIKKLEKYMQQLSEKSFIFVTAISKTALEFNSKSDAEELKSFPGLIQRVKDDYLENYIDFSHEFQDDDFFDTTHLTVKGHETLANILFGLIQ